MQRVAELVEEGLGFVNRQQRRCATHRTSEVTYDRNYGQDSLAVLITLLDIRSTPRTARLAGTGIEIHIKSTQRSVIAIDNLVHLTLGVIYGSLQRSESYAIQAITEEENTTLNIIQRQVLAHILLLEIIILITHLLGEIPPIPRLKFTLVLSVAAIDRLHSAQLLLGALQCGCPNLLEQLINGIGRSGHLIRDNIMSIRVIS